MPTFKITLRSKLTPAQDEKITSLTIEADSPILARDQIEKNVFDDALMDGNLLPVFEIKEFKILSGGRPSKSYHAWHDIISTDVPSWWVGVDGLVKSVNIISDENNLSDSNYEYLGEVDIYLGQGSDPLMDCWNEIGLKPGDHFGPY